MDVIINMAYSTAANRAGVLDFAVSGCHKACNGCTASGADKCRACADGFAVQDEADKCTGIELILIYP